MILKTYSNVRSLFNENNILCLGFISKISGCAFSMKDHFIKRVKTGANIAPNRPRLLKFRNKTNTNLYHPCEENPALM